MSGMSGDQIHPATPARREQARRDGDFAKSQELAAAVQMLGAVVVAYLLFGQLANWLKLSTIESWSDPQPRISIESAGFNSQISGLIFSSLGVLLPILVLLMLFGVLSHWCQSGPVFLAKKVSPDVSRLAPASWFSRLFSLRTIAFPIIGFPKAFLAFGVMLISCWIYREQFFLLGSYPADEMVVNMFGLILQTCLHVAGVLFLTSLLDFGLAWASHQKRIRMTDQELRDELRMQNGDPQIRSQIRARQRI